MAKKTQVNKAFVEKFLKDSNGYPEKGHFEEQKDLQKFYKHLTDEQLSEWVAVEGLEGEVKPTDNPQIFRMRQCMAILYHSFPKAPAKKKKAKYADYTMEKLLQLAEENEVVFEICDDEKILRMRAIMALRASKVIE